MGHNTAAKGKRNSSVYSHSIPNVQLRVTKLAWLREKLCHIFNTEKACFLVCIRERKTRIKWTERANNGGKEKEADAASTEKQRAKQGETEQQQEPNKGSTSAAF